MKSVERRLQKLELRWEEQRSFKLAPSEARRMLEAKIESVRLRLQPEMESEGYEAPDPELVMAMLHAHLESVLC